MATRSPPHAATARRKRRKPSPEPVSRRRATRTRRADCQQTTACGSAASREASCRRCGAHAAAFLSDLEATPESPEAGVAHRAAGVTCWFAGQYREARDHLEQALALFQAGRDDDLAFRFGVEPGTAAMVYLAFASWPLGEVDRATSLIEQHAEADRGSLPCRHARVCNRVRGLLPVDAWRPRARRAERIRTHPTRARCKSYPCFAHSACFSKVGRPSASGEIGAGLDDMRRGVEQLRRTERAVVRRVVEDRAG